MPSKVVARTRPGASTSLVGAKDGKIIEQSQERVVGFIEECIGRHLRGAYGTGIMFAQPFLPAKLAHLVPARCLFRLVHREHAGHAAHQSGNGICNFGKVVRERG